MERRIVWLVEKKTPSRVSLNASKTPQTSTWWQKGLARLKHWSPKKKEREGRSDTKKSASLEKPWNYLSMPLVLRANSLEAKQKDSRLRAMGEQRAEQAAWWEERDGVGGEQKARSPETDGVRGQQKAWWEETDDVGVEQKARSQQSEGIGGEQKTWSEQREGVGADQTRWLQAEQSEGVRASSQPDT